MAADSFGQSPNSVQLSLRGSSQIGVRTVTEAQKERVILLREQGYGYKRIAASIGLTKDQVYSFCRNHGLTGSRSVVQHAGRTSHDVCRFCGKALVQTPGQKTRIFCSAACRVTWWNTHPEAVNKKAVYSYVCASCGQPFTAYGNNHRKYCSRACYIQGRFKGGAA